MVERLFGERRETFGRAMWHGRETGHNRRPAATSGPAATHLQHPIQGATPELSPETSRRATGRANGYNERMSDPGEFHGDDEAFPLFCARCRCVLHPGRGDLYAVRIEAVADPYPQEFTEEDLAGDLADRWEQMVASLGELSAQEAMDQVIRSTVLHFCVSCYSRWIEDPAGT
jgi:hypothetical protein